MTKRNLSKQQQQRIRQKQKDQLDSGEPQQGLVTARHLRHVDVKLADAPDTTILCNVRRNITALAVGDTVTWEKDGKVGVVTAVYPRRTLIERPDGYGKLKPVAANIDQLFIVLANAPEPHSILLDRYLLAAENGGRRANIVLNKMDSLEQLEPFQPLLDIYRALDYPVFIVSCLSSLGFTELKAALVDQSSVFVGQSGVGKSSIINVLLPDVEAPTGDLSERVAKGRHTTTTSKLFDLPSGGYIIDSPGIREFHLNHLSREQIYAGFRELQDLLGQCQFRDCQHDQEPGCAIQAFIYADKMHPSRVQSLYYILNQQE